MRHYSAYYKSKLSVPIPLANLKLWLKADAGITLNGSNVSVWADQSGNGNDATQSNAINQPLFVADGGVDVNNKPVIRFDGTNDWLKSTFSSVIGQPCTIISVFKCLDRNGSVIYGGIDQTNRVVVYNGGGVNNYAAPIAGLFYTNDNAYNINTFILNSTISKLYVNSLLINSNNVGNNGIAGLTIGWEYSNPYGATSLWGDFVEVIIYNSALSDIDRQQVEHYLMTKYGL